MAKRTGASRPAAKSGSAAPDVGDVVWLTFTPQAGREQSGRRPALVLSPRAYNGKVGLCLACPITNLVKGYPFEVALPSAFPVTGVVLADHIENVDWKARHADRVATVPDEVLTETRAKLKALLGF